MTALIVIGCILLFFLLLMLLRVGVSVTYEEKVLWLRVVAGPLKIKLLPAKPKPAKPEKPKKPKKPKKPREEKPKPEEPEKPKPSPLELVKRFVPPALNALGRFRRKLRIDRLTVHYTLGAGDPSGSATKYGYFNAAIGVIMPLLDRSLNIEEQDIGVSVSFVDPEPYIYADVQFTIAIWQILYVAFAMLPALFPPKTKAEDTEEPSKPNRKSNENGEVEQNGQAADQ